MNSKSFSGADLEKALTEGNLTQAQTSLTGMVKPSEESGHVSFTQSGCDTWVDLPTDMIESADHLGQRPCRDHSHPIMRITLKEPKDAQGRILAALLTQATPSPSEVQHVDELRTFPTGMESVALRRGRRRLRPTMAGGGIIAWRNCDDCELLYLACIAAGGSGMECYLENQVCLNRCW